MPSSPLVLIGQLLAGLLLRLVLVVGLAWLIIRFIGAVGRRLEQRVAGRGDAGAQSRLRTLLHTGVHTSQVIVAILAGLTVLLIFGIDIAPVLAGVGVAGLALSLGAQALIRDFIGGMLILVENQFRVGDVIQVGVVTGKVEEITLRYSRLRDAEGRLWIIPNGDVRIVSNNTRDWSQAVVDLNVPQEADMAAVLEALRQAMTEAALDEAVEGDLLAEPEVHGWNSLTDSSVQVRLSVRTRAGRQWEVARILRQYASTALRVALQSSPATPPGEL